MSITKGRDVTNENELQLKETKKDSLKYVTWAFVGAIAFGVPFGFLAYFTGIHTLAPMGAAFGAVYFMTFKVSKERKKNRI